MSTMVILSSVDYEDMGNRLNEYDSMKKDNKVLSDEVHNLIEEKIRLNNAWVECTGYQYPASAQVNITNLKEQLNLKQSEISTYQHLLNEERTKVSKLQEDEEKYKKMISDYVHVLEVQLKEYAKLEKDCKALEEQIVSNAERDCKTMVKLSTEIARLMKEKEQFEEYTEEYGISKEKYDKLNAECKTLTEQNKSLKEKNDELSTYNSKLLSKIWCFGLMDDIVKEWSKLR